MQNSPAGVLVQPKGMHSLLPHDGSFPSPSVHRCYTPALSEQQGKLWSRFSENVVKPFSGSTDSIDMTSDIQLELIEPSAHNNTEKSLKLHCPRSSGAPSHAFPPLVWDGLHLTSFSGRHAAASSCMMLTKNKH